MLDYDGEDFQDVFGIAFEVKQLWLLTHIFEFSRDLKIADLLGFGSVVDMCDKDNWHVYIFYKGETKKSMCNYLYCIFVIMESCPIYFYADHS